MFTWECPTCGREVDIAESECPHCNRPQKATKAAVADPPRTAPPLPRSRKAPAAKRPAAGSWGAQQKQWVVLGVLAVIAVAAAVYLAMPGAGLNTQPEEPAIAEGSGDSGAAYLGEIEVAGIRTSYDADFKTKARAVVINHSESPQSNVNLQVELRTRQSSTTDTPLGSFQIQLDEPLAPHESREVEVDLTALGTLASLPPWHQLRVDLARP